MNVLDEPMLLLLLLILVPLPPQDTRLGKYVNDIRRRTRDHELPKRLKSLVRKWRDACQAECVNGLSPRGPGPGGGPAAPNGRQSISPPFSAPSSIKGSAGGLSPCSLSSSGHTSPLFGRASAPTTPSTLASRVRTMSPSLSVVAKGYLSAVAAKARPQRSPQAAAAAAAPPSSSKAPLPPPAPADPAYTPRVDQVPRTNAANKRLRKDEDAPPPPPAKRPRNNLSNGFEDECSRDSFGSVASVCRVSPPPRPAAKGASRKSGRRRKNAQDATGGSGAPGGPPPDPLRQKMAVIGAKASTKVKTTSELVAELARRKGDAVLARRASRLQEQFRPHPEGGPGDGVDSDSVTQNKREHMEKFLKSQQPGPPIEEIDDDDDDEVTILEDEEEDESEQTSTMPPTPVVTPPALGDLLPLVPASRPDSPPSNMDLLGISAAEGADDILARLPPLDLDAIVWDEAPCEGPCGGPERVETCLVQTLHTTNVDCQNGNFDVDGRFREWHEVIVQKSYQDSPLVVLPYVITDF